MQGMNEAVAAATQKIIDAGEIQAMVEKQVRSTVQSIVKESLSEYSPFGKSLKEAVQSSLSVSASDLGLTQYNAVVLSIVKAQLDASIEEIGRKHLKEELEKLLSDSAPKEIKLSTLITEFRKECVRYGQREDRCTIIFKQSWPDNDILKHCWSLSLDEKSGKTEYAAAYQFTVHRDTGMIQPRSIAHVNIQAGGIFAGGLHGFARLAFQIYATKPKLIVDLDEFDDSLVGVGSDGEESEFD